MGNLLQKWVYVATFGWLLFRKSRTNRFQMTHRLKRHRLYHVYMVRCADGPPY